MPLKSALDPDAQFQVHRPMKLYHHGLSEKESQCRDQAFKTNWLYLLRFKGGEGVLHYGLKIQTQL